MGNLGRKEVSKPVAQTIASNSSSSPDLVNIPFVVILLMLSHSTLALGSSRASKRSGPGVSLRHPTGKLGIRIRAISLPFSLSPNRPAILLLNSSRALLCSSDATVVLLKLPNRRFNRLRRYWRRNSGSVLKRCRISGAKSNFSSIAGSSPVGSLMPGDGDIHTCDLINHVNLDVTEMRCG